MTTAEMKDELAYLIDPDGVIKQILPDCGPSFDLKQLYDAIGCDMIEVLSLRDGRIMIIDEEGKLKRIGKENKLATQLVRHLIQPDDFIVGNAVVCPTEMLE